MRTELQSVLDSVRELALEQLPQLLGELETVRATALLKMSAPAPAHTHDELLTVDQAAQRLGVSTDYLYRNAQQFPFTRHLGRNLRFSALGLDAYLAKRR